MTKEVQQIGANERSAIINWYMKNKVNSLKQARFLVSVVTAINNIKCDCILERPELNRHENALYIAYNLATGNCSFKDVIQEEQGWSIITS